MFTVVVICIDSEMVVSFHLDRPGRCWWLVKYQANVVVGVLERAQVLESDGFDFSF